MCDQQRLRPACAYAQSDQSLRLSHEYSMIVKLLTEHHLEFLSLKGGCRGSSESTYVKMPHSWKSHGLAHMYPIKVSKCIFGSLLVWVDALDASQLFFSHDGTFSWVEPVLSREDKVPCSRT